MRYENLRYDIITFCYIFRSDAKIPIKLAILNGKFVSCIPYELSPIIIMLHNGANRPIGLVRNLEIWKVSDRFVLVLAGKFSKVTDGRSVSSFQYLILFVQHPCMSTTSLKNGTETWVISFSYFFHFLKISLNWVNHFVMLALILPHACLFHP